MNIKMVNVFIVTVGLFSFGECTWYSRMLVSRVFTHTIKDVEKSECALFCEKYHRCETFATETDVTATNCYINDGLTAPSISLSPGSTVEIWAKEANTNNNADDIGETTTTTMEPVTVTQGCPDPFYDVGNVGGCYMTVEETENWNNAKMGCENLDSRAHLVILDTAQEQTALQSQFAGGYRWTAGRDFNNNNKPTWLETGPFVNTTDLNRWTDQQINHNDGDCVALYNYGMKMNGCGYESYYICEIDIM